MPSDQLRLQNVCLFFSNNSAWLHECNTWFWVFGTSCKAVDEWMDTSQKYPRSTINILCWCDIFGLSWFLRFSLQSLNFFAVTMDFGHYIFLRIAKAVRKLCTLSYSVVMSFGVLKNRNEVVANNSKCGQSVAIIIVSLWHLILFSDFDLFIKNFRPANACTLHSLCFIF